MTCPQCGQTGVAMSEFDDICHECATRTWDDERDESDEREGEP